MALVLFFAVYLAGPAALLPTQENDARVVEQLASTARLTTGEGGYHYTALVAALLPGPARAGLVLLTGIAFIVTLFRPLRGAVISHIAVLLAAGPILLFLTVLVKDTFVPWLVAATWYVLTRRLPLVVRLGFVAALYVAYASTFRLYYLLIFAAFVLLVWGKRMRPGSRVLLVALVVIALVAAPAELLTELQGSRDILNARRMGRMTPGARTAFMNLLPPGSAETFVGNYLYAALRLNVPVMVTGAGLREVYLSMSMWLLIAFAAIGLRARDERVWLPAAMFIAHVLVLLVFEPDLGSYLRHAGSVMLYLTPAMALVDRRGHPFRFAFREARSP